MNIMKKITIFVILFMVLLALSCSKYEKPSVVEFNFYYGKWFSSGVYKNFNSKKSEFVISARNYQYRGANNSEYYYIYVKIYGDTAGTYLQSLGQCEIFFNGLGGSSNAMVHVEEPFSKATFEAEFLVVRKDTTYVEKITDGVFR